MLNVNITEHDQNAIVGISEEFRQFHAALMARFPEREWLINQALFALMTGNHLLIFGAPGTAKSLFASTVFDNIIGVGLNGEPPRVFKIQLDNESTKTDLIGPPNIPLFEKTGEMAYNTQGYLPEADFAFIDEFFDGVGVLRSLNDLLNERKMHEGKQNIDIPLMSAIAATNRSPQDIMDLIPSLQLSAVIDRFLFVGQVDYLKDDSSLDQMILDYVSNKSFEAKLSFLSIQRAVHILKTTNQFASEAYLQVYSSVIRAYQKKIGKGAQVTNRRVGLMTQIIEAQALMLGRTTLMLDDIYAIRYALAPHKDSKEDKAFMEVATPLITKAKEQFEENLDQVEQGLLSRLEAELKALEVKVSKPDWAPDNAEIGISFRESAKIRKELENIRPKIVQNETNRVRLLSQATALQEKIANQV